MACYVMAALRSSRRYTGRRSFGFTAVKVLMSVPIGIGILYPFFSDDASKGLLGEIQLIGPTWAAVVVLTFLALVYLYANDLKRSLELVAPFARHAEPKSVWFMFMLPYNFIEDFFIIGNVAKSIQTEATNNPRLASFRSFGRGSGYGWCAAQIVSLVPNEVGSVAGLLAVVLWIWHWRFVRKVNKALAQGR